MVAEVSRLKKCASTREAPGFFKQTFETVIASMLVEKYLNETGWLVYGRNEKLQSFCFTELTCVLRSQTNKTDSPFV